MAYVSICAIVKNEEKYIYEWLSYHYAVGVERFVIFHNSSTDRTLDVIRQWPNSDIVEVVEWPYDAPQTSAYREMLKTRREVAEWCAFIDVDEFLVPRGSRSLHDTLRSVPADCGGLFVHWMFYGSAGHLTRQPGLVTETFTSRGREDFGPNRLGKSIVRLRDAADLISPHVIGSQLRIVNTSGRDIVQDKGGVQEVASHDHLVLNHYFTKSLEEWRVRRALGRPALPKAHPDSIRSEDQFKSHDVNQISDDRAARIMQTARAMFYPDDRRTPMADSSNARYDASAVACQPWLPKTPSEIARQMELQGLLMSRAGAHFGSDAYVAPDAKIFTQYFELGDRSWIASGAIVRGQVIIGTDSSVNAYAHIAGTVRIGNGCRIASLVSIYGFSHGVERTDQPIMSQPITSKGVVIRDDVWIGANAVILDGAEIGAHSVVTGGAVVGGSFPPYSVIGGNPAKLLSNRNNSSSC